MIKSPKIHQFGMPSDVWWLAALSRLTALIGAGLGGEIYTRVSSPTSWRAVLTLAGLAIGLPLLTGLIDLYWRLGTPI